MLLERPGEIVTREELRERIWQADVFVDFDKSLSKATAKVREALGDSPENPRFIETLAKRGYRFLGNVELGHNRPADETPPAILRTDRSLDRRRFFGWTVALVLAIALTVGVALWVPFRGQHRQIPFPVQLPVPLTTFVGEEYAPSFSPDGNQVAFVWNSPNQDNFDIYLKQIGTENVVRLTHDPAPDLVPAWSPDGRFIAFLRVFPNGRAAVLTVPSIGGPPERKVAETSFVDDGQVGGGLKGLAWSRDGKWIVVKDRSPNEREDSLFLFSTDSEQKRRLTFAPHHCGDGAPAFSPDGKTLAFIRTSTFGVSEVHLVDLSEDLTAKGNPRQLTFAKQWINGLAWTNDGKEIVYSSGSNWQGGSVQMWRIAASGQSLPQLLPIAGEHGRRPAISRQGNRLAFNLAYAEDDNIWRLDTSVPDGKPERAMRLIASTRNDYVPQYSPMGSGSHSSRNPLEETRYGSPKAMVPGRSN